MEPQREAIEGTNEKPDRSHTTHQPVSKTKALPLVTGQESDQPIDGKGSQDSHSVTQGFSL